MHAYVFLVVGTLQVLIYAFRECWSAAATTALLYFCHAVVGLNVPLRQDVITFLPGAVGHDDPSQPGVGRDPGAAPACSEASAGYLDYLGICSARMMIHVPYVCLVRFRFPALLQRGSRSSPMSCF